MKSVLLACLLTLSIGLSAQPDEFVGSYIRYIDEVTFETVIITGTEDCYTGQFGEGGAYDINLRDIEVGCYMDEDYFFLMISWDEFEFEISPLEWDENGLISMFELLAEFELPEPLIFNRQYQ